MAYQNFSDRPGNSKSQEKLARIGLPENLHGKRVLDLGCNEGFFSFEAKRRGAAFVLGVDANKKAVRAARRRAAADNADVNFKRGDFLSVTEGPFDIVLLLSALHYAEDPKRVLRHVYSLLAPGGVLILECGIVPGAGHEMRRVLRAIDERQFPSLPLLRDDWLDLFSIRSFGLSVKQAGDPLPRRTFHCVKRKPIVVFIWGKGNVGKSTIARQFKDPLMVQTDALVAPVRHKTNPLVPKPQAALDAAMEASNNDISKAWAKVRTDRTVVRYFADAIARTISLNIMHDLIVIEGFMAQDLAPLIVQALEGQIVVWSLAPGSPGQLDQTMDQDVLVEFDEAGAKEPLEDTAEQQETMPADSSSGLLSGLRSRLRV